MGTARASVAGSGCSCPTCNCNVSNLYSLIFYLLFPGVFIIVVILLLPAAAPSFSAAALSFPAVVFSACICRPCFLYSGSISAHSATHSATPCGFLSVGDLPVDCLSVDDLPVHFSLLSARHHVPVLCYDEETITLFSYYVNRFYKHFIFHAS